MKTQEAGTKKIGIRFCDNDFYYTCTAFLKLLLPDDEHTSHRAQNLTFTKPRIVELFNAMAFSLYMLKQNAWRSQDNDHLIKYLRITEDKVYLDDEVTSFVSEKKWITASSSTWTSKRSPSTKSDED